MSDSKLELSRRELKKKESLQTILKAARRLFEAKGFEATAIEEITELANVSRGTFFNYFVNKDSLLVKMFEEEIQDILFYLENDLVNISSPSERLYRLMIFLIEDTINFRKTCKILVDKISIISPDNDFYHVLEDLVQEAQNRGEISADKNVSHITVMLIGLYLTIVAYNGISPSTSDSCKMLDILFRGIVGQYFDSSFLHNHIKNKTY